MNIDKTIDEFRRGKFELDCRKIVLQQNKERGAIFEGQGYLKQLENGTLIFKIFITEFKNAKPFDHLEVDTAYGVLYTDEMFYTLTAVSRGGTEISASGVRPSIDWDMHSAPCAEIARGQMQSIVAKINQPQPINYLGLYFFEEYEVPLHAMSEAEKHGDKYWTLDTAEFEACACHFTVKVRDGSGLTFVEATSKSTFPNDFHLRIREALQYITGRIAMCRARVESRDDMLILTLESPTRTASHNQFVGPISRVSPSLQKDLWNLFEIYLTYVVKNTPDTFWNPVAYHIYNACEASSNSLDAWAVGVSVAVEAIASLITSNASTKEAEKISALQESMREHLKTLPQFADLSQRMTGLIAMLGKKRPQDVMHELAAKGLVEKTYITAWSKLRNRHVHPSISDLKKPSPADYQQLIDRIHSVEVLLYQLTFYLIGYSGPYTDYGIKGFPTKTYPISEGS